MITGLQESFPENHDISRREEPTQKYRIVHSPKLIREMEAGEIGWAPFDSVGIMESRQGRNPLPYRTYGTRSVLEVHTDCTVQPGFILSAQAIIILRDVDRTFYSPMILVLERIHRWPNLPSIREGLQPIQHLEMDIFASVADIAGFTLPPKFVDILQDAW